MKVLDFGIARVLGRKTRVTSTQTALGTPHYMAPETLQGEEATTQSDVYAIGVILTEMLTGKLPWGESSRSDVSTAMARMVSPPRRLSELLPGAQYPEDLQPALDQFLSQALDNRPVDCAVALQILLQLGQAAGGVAALALAASSISVPPLSSGRQAATAPSYRETAPDLDAVSVSHDRLTRPMRSATAVMNSHRSQGSTSHSRWLPVVVAAGISMAGFWSLKTRLLRPPKQPAVATAIPTAQVVPPALFVPNSPLVSEPQPSSAPAESTKPEEPAMVTPSEKKEPDSKPRRRAKRTKEKPSGPPKLLYPLDTKGY